jgi:hypothetical protein
MERLPGKINHAQAHLLTKLIAADWRLQAEVTDLLSPEQREKLDEVNRAKLSVQ